MGDNPRQRISKKFEKFLVDEYEDNLKRDFSFPKATDMLLVDIEKIKIDMEKMIKKKKL